MISPPSATFQFLQGESSRPLVLSTFFRGDTANVTENFRVLLHGSLGTFRHLTHDSSLTIHYDSYGVPAQVHQPVFSHARPSRGKSSRQVLDLMLQSAQPNSRRAEGLAVFIANCARLPEVKAVTVSFDNDVIQLRTFLTSRSRKIRDRVYVLELDLMERFPDLVFDFNLATRTHPRTSDYPSSLDLEGQICCYISPER